jgi:pSer/pThr/pTyr-binding forkhead associated (FHA) protein
MLKLDDTAVVLFDLNSTNGTRVNSMEVMQSVMQNDDIITVGQYALKIENLPAVSNKMAEKIREADTVTLDSPDDIRRSRTLRNIQRSRADKETPVAVLTAEDFDATQVDPWTVTFGPDGTMKVHNASHVRR